MKIEFLKPPENPKMTPSPVRWGRILNSQSGSGSWFGLLDSTNPQLQRKTDFVQELTS